MNPVSSTTRRVTTILAVGAVSALACVVPALGATPQVAFSPAGSAAITIATPPAPVAPVAVAVPAGPGTQPYTGGQTVPPGEFAFVAGLRDTGGFRFFCTGSLVDPHWILTAAHCVDEGKIPSGVEVVVGDTDLDTASDPAETRAVDQIVIHPKWRGKTAGTHDVAMVHLSTPSTMPTVIFGVPKALKKGVKACETIRRVAVGPMAPTVSVMPCPIGAGFGLGWGRTSEKATTTSTTLKQANAKIFDRGPKTFWRAKSGACPGDSGGPLVVRREDGAILQIGVASYNQHGGGTWNWLVGGRCSPRGYDFYSNVAAGELLTWFEGVMA